MERWAFKRFDEFMMPGAGMFLDSNGSWVDADEAETEIAKLQDAHAEAQRQNEELRRWATESNDAVVRLERENEELRADLVWAMDGDNDAARGDRNLFFRDSAIAFDGTDADLCRAIREARRGD